MLDAAAINVEKPNARMRQRAAAKASKEIQDSAASSIG
jgi:hypothetical protein